ncbi:GNAT family N-acetyltransferase [Mycolicibacterium gadium]|jgi:ribosomal protein S18 acetylase RimI-like enzyme|uniref:GNAT family N-acetyltransferase n=1 Tax=Mycolicibacterium gadium TaxID=1794 RepID=UPI002FDD1295
MTRGRADPPTSVPELIARLRDETTTGCIYDWPGPPIAACLQLPNVVARHRKILQRPPRPAATASRAPLEPVDHALGEVAALFRSCFAPDTCERQLYDTPADPFEDHLAQLAAGQLVGPVDWARSGGVRSDAAGLTAAVIATRPQPGMVWIAWLLVSPAVQRRGLGKLLLTSAADGTDPVRLTVTANTAAAAFYRHLGFNERSEATLYRRAEQHDR